MSLKRDDDNDDNNFAINTEYEVSLYVIYLRPLLRERFEVIAAFLKFCLFWDVTSCGVANNVKRVYTLILDCFTLKMEALGASKTTVTIYQSTRRNNLENLHFPSSLSLSWSPTLHSSTARLCLTKESNT
jgi:hypothetical protein